MPVTLLVVLLVVSSLISVPLGTYFVHQVNLKHPTVFASSKLPRAASIVFNNWPPSQYVDYLFSRRYRSDLASDPKLVLIGECVFWLLFVQFGALILWLITWIR